eukprot:1379818-Alexandrium_andersonii.AAC.1
MSASLVGSEMCIRDRPRALQPPAPLQPARKGPRLQPQQPGERRSPRPSESTGSERPLWTLCEASRSSSSSRLAGPSPPSCQRRSSGPSPCTAGRT